LGGQEATKTIERVKIAFRKLKAHVYFDKTALPLRDEIVKYESESDFEEKLAAIASAYDNCELAEDSPFFSSLLHSISTLPFPKKMKAIEQIEDTVISVGNPKEEPVVSELQYFIDMDVSCHIIGVLWILAFGKRLDDMCFEKARGNRLRSALIWDENGDVISTPALFQPYFAQYSLWRDGGLSSAEDLLAQGHDALILTLDLKRFYYKAGLSIETFETLIDDEESKCDRCLHSAVFSIMKRYTQVLKEKNVDLSGVVLPIGFLPSAVLSNWCLSKFDQGILDFWNPNYYGRYVDDIIIVEKIERGSDIHKKARENLLTKDSVIEYYLGNGRRKMSKTFVEQRRSGEADTQTQKSGGEKSDSYRVCKPFCLSEESCLEFQSIKTRIIALFAENNSNALLNKFKNEIHENVSEFRLMPDVGDAFSQDDFSDFYRLDNDATINKLRGIKDISMDKYELSKFLGRYRVVSSLVDDGSIKKFTKTIGKMFNNCELIDNYMLWERILEIFITDKDYKGFANFAKKINAAIKGISIEKSKSDSEDVRGSLRSHFVATLNRVLSLLWGENVLKITKLIEEPLTLRAGYIRTRMSNKYVLAVPNEILACPSDEHIDATINLTDFSDAFKCICEGQACCAADKNSYLPYFRQAQDISIAMLLSSISSGCGYEQRELYKTYISSVRDEVEEAPIKFIMDDGEIKGFAVGEDPNKKMRIAIANVNVGNVSDLDSVLKGRKPNRKHERYRDLAKLINDAIVEKADMLVLPENYVPFEWLPQLASKAAREGLAIIAGVEHVIAGIRKVFNFTAVALPFKYFKTVPTAAVFFN